MVLFMVMIVFISCSQSWYLLMSWNIFVAMFVTTSGKSSSNQIIVFIIDVRVYLKFDLLEIVLHGVAGSSPFREHVHHSEDSLVSTWMKMVGRKSTMEREQVQLVPWFPRKHLDEDDWEVFVVGQQWKKNNRRRKMFLWFLYGLTRTHVVRSKDHSIFRFVHSAFRKESV